MRNPYLSFQHLFVFSLSRAARMGRQVAWPSSPTPHLDLSLSPPWVCAGRGGSGVAGSDHRMSLQRPL
jgi:hypothetical protein